MAKNSSNNYIFEHLTNLRLLFVKLFFSEIIHFGCAGSSCCVQALSRCSERGVPFVAGHELLVAVTSPVAEHEPSVHRLQRSQRRGLSGGGSQRQLLLSSWDLPGLGIKPMSRCFGRLNHWTTREAL